MTISIWSSELVQRGDGLHAALAEDRRRSPRCREDHVRRPACAALHRHVETKQVTEARRGRRWSSVGDGVAIVERPRAHDPYRRIGGGLSQCLSWRA